MGIINILSKETVNKIAAGEVVADASSVVKELMENSIDAGSTSVRVKISQAGKKLIEVADNGSGIFTDDIPKVFLRNATSKIRDDISAISSLGFRGEALASIAQVSRITLITRTSDSELGTSVEAEEARIVSEKAVSANRGTTIRVTDLFYNLPARKKHISEDNTAAAQIIDTVGKIAISRPDISVTLINDNKTVFTTPGDGSLKNAAVCVYGRDALRGMMEMEFTDDPLYISGLIVSPAFIKDRPSYRIVILNGRYIESVSVNRAVDSAYNELTGKSSAQFILNMTLPYSMVDVNIHPAKKNVRFMNESLICMLVKQGVKDCLASQIEIKTHSSPDDIPEEEGWHSEAMVFDSLREYMPAAYRDYGTVKDNAPSYSDASAYQISDMLTVDRSSKTETEIGKPDTAVLNKDILLKLSNMEVIGNAFGLYALIEYGDDLYAMDTHAAHERVLYEKYLKAFNSHSIAVQELMTPVYVELSPKRCALITANADQLGELGFGVEEYSGNCILVRSIPMYLNDKDIAEIIRQISGEIESFGSSTDLAGRNALLIRCACHDAVRGRENISGEESRYLLRQLYETDMPFTCPHGRPILGKISEKYFMKVFERIK
ncbi:MAG: DNA mismatch repair endonuclease MutL [Eubacteriaceae bacterium]|nr:DNA mismatch repair endonuclease MutL [Eubacteriaceae bacterium]